MLNFTLSTISRNCQAEMLSLRSSSSSVQDAIQYNKKFLEDYSVNRPYLSQTTCLELACLGKTKDLVDKRLYEYLLVDMAWNSSRLEGNTYSFLETKTLIEQKKIAEGKSITDTQMILNHKEAIDFLQNKAIIHGLLDSGRVRETILTMHTLLARDLLFSGVGRLRKERVRIGNSRFLPLKYPEQIEACFDLITKTVAIIPNAFEQAFFLLVHLPYLQPFMDVNKRVSRLVANIPLLHQTYFPLSFNDVPKDIYIDGLMAIYELNRVDILREVFVWAYKRSVGLYTTKLGNQKIWNK
ncbi:MAG: Fic family protein [Chlamydiales bacterium]